MKQIIDKLDFIKTKNFCSAEGTVKRIKREVTSWEKIFAKDMSHKGTLAKLHEELLTRNLAKQWVKDLNRHLTKENTQMVNKHMKRL